MNIDNTDGALKVVSISDEKFGGTVKVFAEKVKIEMELDRGLYEPDFGNRLAAYHLIHAVSGLLNLPTPNVLAAFGLYCQHCVGIEPERIEAFTEAEKKLWELHRSSAIDHDAFAQAVDVTRHDNSEV